MQILVAVDWTDQSFSAVKETVRLYAPQSLTLVHAVDLGILDYPALAPAMGEAVYQDMRTSMLDAGHQLLERTAELVVSTVPAVRKVCRLGSPASVVLDTVQEAGADLIVLGARGLSRVAELVFGGVSHRVLLNAPCPVLLVKGEDRPIRRVLIAVEGMADGEAIRTWVARNPFRERMTATVLTVAPAPYLSDPAAVAAYQQWGETVKTAAHDLAHEVAKKFADQGISAAGIALTGDPVEVIINEATSYDLVIVGSHSRRGLDRLLLGSVSHAVTHGVQCPVVVVKQHGAGGKDD